MNTLNNANDLMLFGAVLKTINALGFRKYSAQIVRAEKTESETIVEILKTETLTRNQKKLLNLAQRLSSQVSL